MSLSHHSPSQSGLAPIVESPYLVVKYANVTRTPFTMAIAVFRCMLTPSFRACSEILVLTAPILASKMVLLPDQWGFLYGGSFSAVLAPSAPTTTRSVFDERCPAEGPGNILDEDGAWLLAIDLNATNLHNVMA